MLRNNQMVFGQFLAERPFSVILAAGGLALWLVLGRLDHGAREAKEAMMDPTGIFIILGGITLSVAAVAIWDWLAERERLRKRHRGHSA